MKDPIKLLTKDYFNRHPVKEHSAARILYSMLLMPEVLSCMEDMLPELDELAAQNGVMLPDYTRQRVELEREEDTDRLLRMLRQTLAPDVCEALLVKLLKREAEALPEIRRMILKTFNDNAIENCVRYMTRCNENSSEWILQNFEAVREPYARSMLCLVLGFRAGTDVIPFLMRQVERFEAQFPEDTFDQAPLLALHEIRARFRTV